MVLCVLQLFPWRREHTNFASQVPFTTAWGHCFQATMDRQDLHKYTLWKLKINCVLGIDLPLHEAYRSPY